MKTAPACATVAGRTIAAQRPLRQEIPMKFTQTLCATARGLRADGRCHGPAGRDGQDRLDRRADRPDRGHRPEPVAQLPVHGRALQQEQSGRREVRDRLVRQQAEPAGNRQRAAGRHRPGHPLCRAGHRHRAGDRDHRLPEQVQRAQPRQGGAVPQLRRGRPRPDQQQVQLLALPARRRHVDEDGGAVHLHEGPARRQEGLPDQPELRPRPPGGEVRQGERWRASAPTSRSSAKT